MFLISGAVVSRTFTVRCTGEGGICSKIEGHTVFGRFIFLRDLAFFWRFGKPGFWAADETNGRNPKPLFQELEIAGTYRHFFWAIFTKKEENIPSGFSGKRFSSGY